MIVWLRHLLFGSIRRRLILGIVLVHAVMMTLFVFDLVHRQRQFLHQQTLERAVSLARATAASGTQWVLSNDLIGMEELVHGLAAYPDLRYAMILAPDGRVLAHSNPDSVGRYVADPLSLSLLTSPATEQTLVDKANMVDVAYPILRDRQAVGWMRIGLGQDRQAASLNAVTREGLVYTLLAILIGALFALFMARGLTRGLYALRRVADNVRAGHHDLRANLSRDDEIGQLAAGFDRMVDQLVDNERRLQASQDELRASRRLLDSVVENMPLMIFLKRAEDLRFVLLNKAAENLLGFKREEMLGKNDHDLFPPEQADFFIGKDREVLASHATLDIVEESISTRNLGQRVLHTRKLGLRDDAGQPEYLLGISEDITESKRVREELARHREHLEILVAERTAALAESELSYRTVANFTSDWETWLGEDGRYRYVSPSCEGITGYRAEEFMRDPGLMLNILLPEDRTRVAPHFLGEGSSIDSLLLEFRIRRRDGETIWIEHACRPVHDDSGRFLGRRASNRDISEHKRLAVELAQARDQAEAANRAKSVFLANMSHELRTPLNAILGFAQLMERDAQLSPEQRRNLATIHRSGHHLLDLINDVLDISRIEAGRTAIQAAPFDLDDTLRAIEEMTRVRADAKGLSFVVERVEPVPRYVNGDAPRLRQILLNLLSNAVKYTDRGGVRLRIAAADAGRLLFEVIDTGPGIPNAEQQRIFEAFYQTSAGAAKGEGAGLGLAISREYARLMGGELGMRGEAGQGSTFYCILPLPEVASSLADIGLPHRVTRLKPGQRNIDVLVVEDNADNRELLCHLLERVGFHVRTAGNGVEALAEFQKQCPDFVWMDMRMPLMDGYEATRRIRALPGGGEVKIAALTASAFRENRDDILAAGCDEMVAKPLDEQQIFETMARLLGVAFDYERAVAEGARTVATTTALPVLPPELAAALRAAAESLDIEACRGLIERIEVIDADAAINLHALVSDFRFEELLRLLPTETV
jgi:PAS domain S-box-containing protein